MINDECLGGWQRQVVAVAIFAFGADGDCCNVVAKRKACGCNRGLVFLIVTVLIGSMPAHAQPAAAKKAEKTSCRAVKPALGPADGTAAALHLDAGRGDVDAMNALAVMYAEGIGVTKSACMAKQLFLSAANRGHAPAMVNLGMMHALGDNLRRDGSQAYAWIRAALYVGISAEERDATVFKLGMVAAHLEPGQVERAEAMAKRIADSVALSRAPAVENDGEPPRAEKRT